MFAFYAAVLVGAYSNHALSLRTNNADRLTVDTSGNVGIGTTSPASLFSITGGTGNYFGSDGRVGFGGKPTVNFFSIFWDPAIEQGIVLRPKNETYNGAPIYFQNSSGGIAGNITQTTSAVAYNTSSDRRLKENVATTTAGLSTLLQIPVRDFDFISDPSHAQTQGFIAQELRQYYPYAVTTNGDNGTAPLGATSTPWLVDYGRLTPLIVKSIQDIANLSDTFKAKLVAWFADAANGIGDFFAGRLHTREICLGEPGAETCVGKTQLDALLAGAAASQGAGGTGGGTSSGGVSSGVPVMQISGNNPATVDIGTTYADLGAIITGPTTADTNLGIRYFVDGLEVSSVQIDTSEAGEHTVEYVATNASGTATSTRTVIIEAPADAPIIDTASSTPETSVITDTSASSTPSSI